MHNYTVLLIHYRVQEALEQADQEEQRAIALVKKNAKLERRLHEMEERVRGSKRQTNVIELEDNPSSDSGTTALVQQLLCMTCNYC